MRRAVVSTVVFGAAVMVAATAFGWGFGTHAYVAGEIGKRGGDPNLNEVYGSTLPDLFNYAFEADCDYDALYAVTHDTDFMDVYDTKNRGLEKWIAAGVVMHNQPFGIDHTAHIMSAVNGWPGGYVNLKAEVMNAYLISPGIPGVYPLQDVLLSMGIVPDPDTVHQLYHTIIEYSADLLLKEAAPWVGPTLLASANFWSYDEPFPLVLADAFANEVAGVCGPGIGDPEVFIATTEIFHRNVVTNEALLLTIADPGEALWATALHLATFGMGYLGMPYDPTDPYSQAIHDQFAALSSGYMQVAMGYFLGDYFAELDATVDLVQQNMVDYGVIRK
ncbi:MAG: hypothetical protein P1S46_09920 [bacterium]|nr:hypothetical protein [bacterium]MDT8396109.1 hypothetical protein [bacterium]